MQWCGRKAGCGEVKVVGFVEVKVVMMVVMKVVEGCDEVKVTQLSV